VFAEARRTDTVPMNGLADAMSPHKLAEIKRQIESGQYRVDPYAVADAMIRWCQLDIDSAGRRVPRARAQNECSKPARSSAASVKTASAGPSTTVPIKVRAAIVVGHAA
jgi:anti-sigma-28 factor FlgM